MVVHVKSTLNKTVQTYLIVCNIVYLRYLAMYLLQGVRTQTVTSNLDLTERKHAINFDLKVDSDQGRLEI